MKKFEEHIKRKLGHHTTAVDTDALWEHINGAIPTEEDKRKKRPIWIIILGVLVGFFLVGGAYLWKDATASFSTAASPVQYPLNWDTPSLYYPLLQGQATTIYQAETPNEKRIATSSLVPVGDDIMNNQKIHTPLAPLEHTIPQLPTTHSSSIEPLPSRQIDTIAYLEMPPQFVEMKPAPKEETAEAVTIKEVEKTATPPKNRMALGVTYTHFITKSMLQAKEQTLRYYTQKRRDTEVHQYTFGVGISWVNTFKNQLRFRTGLAYMQVNQRFDYHKRRMSQAAAVQGEEILLNPNNAIAATPAAQRSNASMGRTELTVNVQRQHRYYMLDIPLVLGYEYQLQHCSVVMEGGIYYNLRTFTDAYMMQLDGEYGHQSEQTTTVFKKRHGFSTYTGISLQFPISNKLQFTMGGQLRYTPYSITEEAHPTSQRLMNMGLHTGFYMSL